jgi:hypothetical protein
LPRIVPLVTDGPVVDIGHYGIFRGIIPILAGSGVDRRHHAANRLRHAQKIESTMRPTQLFSPAAFTAGAPPVTST